MMTHFLRGGRVILQQRFNEADVFKAVERDKITFLNLVPTMLSRLISHPDLSKYDLGSIRLIMHGGGPITMELVEKSMRALGPQRFYTSLGSTEANGMLTSFPTREHALDGTLAAKLSSVGRDGFGVEVKIVDPEGRELPPGEVGEITGKGDNISPGYWKMPDESALTFKDGWLYSDDLGYRDDDGYIFIVDRKNDIVITGGENVSCAEVEQVIQSHPLVHEAAVIGIPDAEWGEALMAVVGKNPAGRSGVTAQEIIDHCGAQLAAFKKPKSVQIHRRASENGAWKDCQGRIEERFGDIRPKSKQAENA